MFARSGKKEIWIGMGMDIACPEIELTWGRDREASVSFEEFIEWELGQNEQSGPNSGKPYSEDVLVLFENMIDTLQRACNRVRRRNGEKTSWAE